ncbi:MAG: bifunctional oligoribonuclease/PAP phosphatase NrnA [Planctomycetota bacterium]
MIDLAAWTPAQRGALAALRSADRVLLTGHVRPDGDCLGSQAALARALELAGHTVRIVNSDLPEDRYDYLARDTRFEAFDGHLDEFDAIVLLDCHDLDRLDAMAPLVAASQAAKIVVDHHPHEGEAWWNEAFLDPSAAATGCLVWRLALALETPPDSIVDRGVFTALVSDTGWFKYSNTDHETLSIAAEVVGRGLDTAALYQRLHQQSPATEPRAIARFLDRLQYVANERIAVLDQPLTTNDETRVDAADVVLDIVRAVGSVEVVLYLRELEGGLCKLSARSKTDFDVNRLARQFGGGGHAKASGATIPGTLDEVRGRLVAAAEEQLQQPAGTRG